MLSELSTLFISILRLPWVKPTSSIATSKKSIDENGNEVEVVTKGRHDPCVGIRAVPVGEAMMACVLLDQYLINRGQIG